MIALTPNERHNILNNHKHFDEETLCYWYNKITNRLDYLNPLFNEIRIKGLELRVVSKELAQEVFEIVELKKILGKYKKYNYSCECGLKTNDYLEWKQCVCKNIIL